MSTYWGYYCLDCQDESDHWLNHGEAALREYFEITQMIEESGKEFIWLEIGIMGGDGFRGEMSEFLAKHWGHSIALRNEYGHTKPIKEKDRQFMYSKLFDEYQSRNFD